MEVKVINYDANPPEFEAGELYIGTLGSIVLCSDSLKGHDVFCGTLVGGRCITLSLGGYSREWSKDEFTRFRGEIIFKSK